MTKIKFWKEATNWRALAALGLMIFLIFNVANTSTQNDFIQFHIASHQFLHRLNPYDTQVYPASFRYGCPYPPVAFYLTLLPSMLGPVLSSHLWDVLCLLLYMATLYLWFTMFRKREPVWHEFSFYAVAMTTASCFWAFHYHHMIVPVLFFATVAIWLMNIKRNDFLSGIATGIMLMKPHLLCLTAAGLFLRSKRRLHFSAGVLTALTLQFVPFLIGYRPFSDLKGLITNPNSLATKVYWSDEQSMASLFYRELYVKAHHSDYISFDGVQGRIVDVQLTSKLNKVKTVFFGAGFLATLAGFRKTIRKNPVLGFAWLLAIGVLISPYSHSYDALLITPLLAYAVISASRRWSMPELSAYLLPANVLLGYFLVIGTRLQPWWNHMAWCSTIYVGISILILGYFRINQEVSYEK